MKINLDGHVIEYFWDDEEERALSEKSLKAIRSELASNHLSGRFTQENGEGHICGWRDVNVEDSYLWSYMNGWFNQ